MLNFDFDQVFVVFLFVLLIVLSDMNFPFEYCIQQLFHVSNPKFILTNSNFNKIRIFLHCFHSFHFLFFEPMTPTLT